MDKSWSRRLAPSFPKSGSRTPGGDASPTLSDCWARSQAHGRGESPHHLTGLGARQVALCPPTPGRPPPTTRMSSTPASCAGRGMAHPSPPRRLLIMHNGRSGGDTAGTMPGRTTGVHSLPRGRMRRRTCWPTAATRCARGIPRPCGTEPRPSDLPVGGAVGRKCTNRTPPSCPPGLGSRFGAYPTAPARETSPTGRRVSP